MEISADLAVKSPLKLRAAVAIFIGCYVGGGLAAKLAAAVFGLTAGVVGYLAVGFVLNRIVLRGLVEPHPIYSTVGNISSFKLWYFLLWPLAYPLLFLRLAIIKAL